MGTIRNQSVGILDVKAPKATRPADMFFRPLLFFINFSLVVIFSFVWIYSRSTISRIESPAQHSCDGELFLIILQPIRSSCLNSDDCDYFETKKLVVMFDIASGKTAGSVRSVDSAQHMKNLYVTTQLLEVTV